MKRINYNGGYLYCSITGNCTTSDLVDNYGTFEELYEDYKDDILQECAERGYDEYETEAVLSHYRIKWSNYNWNKYIDL